MLKATTTINKQGKKEAGMDLPLEPTIVFLAIVTMRCVQDLVQESLRNAHMLACVRRVRHGPFDNGVETMELLHRVLGAYALRFALVVTLEGPEDRLVDRVLLVVLVRRDGGPGEHVLLREAVHGPDLLGYYGHVGRGEGARLVGAEHLHGRDLLKGGEVCDDGFLLRHRFRAHGHGDLHAHRKAPAGIYIYIYI